ncbi:energy-coupling factor transporter ATPase [uncultured Helcococcus sp.]|uniref:energy-coupling factor transporter ATPase n=1 Tax=uncultured Helcococcus sp. TaxID=1072508 RepID=UPI002601AD7A|nr:energy-coupling factor transporter ATPase [uncultured Helcococcus sp.]
MIELKDVRFKYEEEGEDVLKGINLRINDGEFISILGKNGSGKSTIAKLLNAQIYPVSGQVLIDGKDSKDVDVWELRRKVGMVFQNPDNQIVATVVEEDVAFGPENLGIENPELRQRVDKALETVGMENFKLHAPHMLSGGQKQRVAIAGVLAMDPDLIVFDEPTSMLDPTGRKEVIDHALKLNKEDKKTVINITHFMNEAVLSDRVVVINEGQLVLDGTPKEVFSQVDKIKEYGLDVPQVSELAFMLKNKGIDLPDGILTIEELVDSL